MKEASTLELSFRDLTQPDHIHLRAATLANMNWRGEERFTSKT